MTAEKIAMIRIIYRLRRTRKEDFKRLSLERKRKIIGISKEIEKARIIEIKKITKLWIEIMGFADGFP